MESSAAQPQCNPQDGTPAPPADAVDAYPQQGGWSALVAALETLVSVCERVFTLGINGTLIQAICVLTKHVLAVGGLVLCFRGQVKWQTCLLAASLWPVSGLGITAGAHRLWTHGSYKVTPAMELLLLIFYSFADQGPILGWALTHTVHHKNSDTEDDPHNRNAGFWHAHFGWIFSARVFEITADDRIRCESHMGPMAHLHDRVCLVWGPIWSLGVPALICSSWGDATAGILVAGALRWCFVQHVTFFVNSVAHGERTSDDMYLLDGGAATGIGPKVSLLVTALALGEGWHDYHHQFPWDYAAAELGALDQWNPTKAFIDMCAALGIVTHRKRCSWKIRYAHRSRVGGAFGMYEKKGPLFLRYLQPVPAEEVLSKPEASMYQPFKA